MTRLLSTRFGRAARIVTLVVVCLVTGCSRGPAGGSTVSPGAGPTRLEAPDGGCEARDPVDIAIDVHRRLPHDATSYTQGLVVSDGILFESSGLYGESALRTVDRDDGRTLQRVLLPPNVFGEGIAITGDGVLIQLLWKEGVALRWMVDGFASSSAPLGEFTYEGEGWGLTTHANGNLLMSDGSDRLIERDPLTFDVVAVHTITRTDGSGDLLNELEFDGRWVWANRYQTDEIVRIDPHCWMISGVADVGVLHEEAAAIAAENGSGIDVANGIAYDVDDDTYVLTGKLWPVAFVVSLDEESV